MKKYVTLLALLLVLPLSMNTIHAQERIRIMSLNMDQGQDNTLDSICRFINKFSPDVVGIQEMDIYPKRDYAPHEHGVNFIAEMMYFTSLYGIFGKAFRVPAGWDYGNAVLSANSFIKTENVPLPRFGYETRSILITTFDFKGHKICFASTHLNFDNQAIREAQIKYIAELMDKQDADIKFVCGDFNSPENGFVLDLMPGWQDALPAHKKTFSAYPENYKRSKLDYILYKSVIPLKVRDTQIECDASISDHCACFVEIEIPDIKIIH